MSAAAERDDLVAALAKVRGLLRRAVREITDEQAAAHPTVSELCLGGIIRHVTAVERTWMRFIAEGPSAMSAPMPERMAAHARGFAFGEGDSLAEVLDEYAAAAAETDAVVTTLPDLDASQPLPEARWFEPGARWSARQVILHVISETAQHSGHADIIRESIDGAKTMG